MGWRFEAEMWVVIAVFVAAVVVGPLWLIGVAWMLWLVFVVIEIEVWYRRVQGEQRRRRADTAREYSRRRA